MTQTAQISIYHYLFTFAIGDTINLGLQMTTAISLHLSLIWRPFVVTILTALFLILYSFFASVSAYSECTSDTASEECTTFTKNNWYVLLDSISTSILGHSQLHPEINSIASQNSLIASMNNLLSSLYAQPPASGVAFISQELQKLNPIQPVYAQTGAGYDALIPVQDLWRIFRNASYIGFALVFVVIGFMVMFRAHISPQAVATIQDSLPRIVVALILVTFSYALAGLMLDLMFLVINIILQLLQGAGVINADVAARKIFDLSFLNLMRSAWDDIFGVTAEAVHSIIGNVFEGGGLLTLLKWPGQLAAGGLAAVVVGFAAIIIVFRILIMLLMAYVMIILLTLAAPFYFLIQALPGNNGAKDWFKQMASNIAVFPVVSFMIIFAGVIGGIEALGGGSGAGRLVGVGQESLKFPLLTGGLDPTAISRIIALGFLFITPEVANIVKNAIGVKTPAFAPGVIGGFAAGAAAGRQFGGGVAPHIPLVGRGLDWMAAEAELPKMRRQSVITRRALGKGFTVPGAYQTTGTEEKT